MGEQWRVRDWEGGFLTNKRAGKGVVRNRIILDKFHFFFDFFRIFGQIFGPRGVPRPTPGKAGFWRFWRIFRFFGKFSGFSGPGGNFRSGGEFLVLGGLGSWGGDFRRVSDLWVADTRVVFLTRTLS